ncbi:MAG: 50S ribosomal protein L29 [Proteobacteria bacterium]|nr:50S ribosomal protein L29 [Pseudomonadota bacterium]
MKTNEMRGKSAAELGEHIVDLRREQFSLRMQKAQGGEARTHDFKRVRREIARARTVLNEQSKQGGSK